MMRIPSYIQRSRHGIYFFRIAVPKALRETVNGRREIKHSLQTRDLRATKTITLPDGTKHAYDLQTDSSDLAEIAAFERQVEKERAELTAAEERYRAQAPAVFEAMLAHQREQQAVMEAYKRELEAERAQRAAEKAEPKAAEKVETALRFTPDPKNIASRRWAEYVAMTEGVGWTAGRTPVANKKKFQEFLDWWGEDVGGRSAGTILGAAIWACCEVGPSHRVEDQLWG